MSGRLQVLAVLLQPFVAAGALLLPGGLPKARLGPYLALLCNLLPLNSLLVLSLLLSPFQLRVNMQSCRSSNERFKGREGPMPVPDRVAFPVAIGGRQLGARGLPVPGRVAVCKLLIARAWWRLLPISCVQSVCA